MFCVGPAYPNQSSSSRARCTWDARLEGCSRSLPPFSSAYLTLRHPPFAERRVLAFWVFEMTRGRGLAPEVRAANEWMRRTVTTGWVSGIHGMLEAGSSATSFAKFAPTIAPTRYHCCDIV